MNPFQRVKSDQAWFERIQDYLNRFFAVICRNPFIEGQEITATLSSGATTAIGHSLGRVPRLWLLLDVSTTDAVTAPSPIERRAWTDKTITLFANKAYSIKLWVI
jgi:hypothetical protein